MQYNQWLHDVLYKFSSLDNYRDSIHYRYSFTATIVIVKLLLSLSTRYIVCTFNYTKPFSIDHDWHNVDLIAL